MIDIKSITTLSELKEAITQLEGKKMMQEEDIKKEFKVMIFQLRPANLVKSTISEIIRTPNLINYFVDTSIGVGTGVLFKKMFTRFSSNPFKYIIGTALQYGVTNFVTNHAGPVKSVLGKVYDRFFKRQKVMTAM